MRYSLSVLLPLLLIATAPARADVAKPSDFYCNETLQSQPLFFEIAAKACPGAPKADAPHEGLCFINVKCVYVSDDVRKLADAQFGKDTPGKDFEHATEEEKIAFLQKSQAVDWLPANLTCPGLGKEGGQFICPSADRCKGDVYYKPQGAYLGSADFPAYQNRNARGAIKVFNAGPATPAKEKDQ